MHGRVIFRQEAQRQYKSAYWISEDQTIGAILGEAEACLLCAIVSIRHGILGIQGQCSTCINAKLVKNASR